MDTQSFGHVILLRRIYLTNQHRLNLFTMLANCSSCFETDPLNNSKHLNHIVTNDRNVRGFSSLMTWTWSKLCDQIRLKDNKATESFTGFPLNSLIVSLLKWATNIHFTYLFAKVVNYVVQNKSQEIKSTLICNIKFIKIFNFTMYLLRISGTCYLSKA